MATTDAGTDKIEQFMSMGNPQGEAAADQVQQVDDDDEDEDEDER
jgi:hypothetical protein